MLISLHHFLIISSSSHPTSGTHYELIEKTIWCKPLIAALGVLTIPESDAQDAAKTAPVSDPAALAIDQQIISEIREHSDIMKNLQYISDEIGHRLTGSPSLKKANDWTAAKMKEYGLTDVHLEAWEIPAGWERGTATLTLIDPTPGRQLTVAAMGWTPVPKAKSAAMSLSSMPRPRTT